MPDKEQDELERVQKYRELVLLYESLDHQIDDLIMQYDGGTENMPPDALARYRELAHQRDEVQNDMRALEQELDLD